MVKFLTRMLTILVLIIKPSFRQFYKLGKFAVDSLQTYFFSARKYFAPVIIRTW